MGQKQREREKSPLEKEQDVLYELQSELQTIEDQLFPTNGNNIITLPAGVKNPDEYEKNLENKHKELVEKVKNQLKKVAEMKEEKELFNNLNEDISRN